MDHTSTGGPSYTLRQGLTHVHFSAQLEPCLTHTKHPTHPNALNTPEHPLNKGYTTPYVHPLSHEKRSS